MTDAVATLTADDAAFPCELADRVSGRTQTILRGTVRCAGDYRTNGVPCDLAIKTSPGRFPLGNYRVVIELDGTTTYYAVYDHTNKKIKILSDLGAEISDLTAIDLTFGFLSVGE